MEGNLLHELIRSLCHDLGVLVQVHSKRRRFNHRILFLPERLDRWGGLRTVLLQEDKPVQRIPEKPDQGLDNPLFGGSDHLCLAELLSHSNTDGYGSDPHLNEPLLDLNSCLFATS